MSKSIQLLTNFKTLNVGDEELTITGLANAQTIDRVGDIIIEDAYKKGGLDNYLKNPIILFNHDYGKPIGKATEISVGASGLTITAKISKAAGNVYDLIKDEVIKAFSVGFSIKDAEYDSQADVLKITDIELYEVSAVAVPANADSVFDVSKQLNEVKQQYKEKFAQSADINDDSANAQIEEKDMPKTQAEIELEKLKDRLAAKDAELKAAEGIIDEAAKAEEIRQTEAKEKAQAAQVTSQVEDLIKEVEKRFEEKEATVKEAVSGLESALKEKAEEIETLKRNKMAFEDHGSREAFAKSEKEDAVLVAKLLGKDIANTEFYKNLVEKSGVEHTPSSAWEQEFNTTIYGEMRDKLVVEPLFSTIAMNTPLMNIPTNPEAGDAQWISSNANPNLNLRGANSTGTAVDHKLGETTLQAYKLASKEYIGYEEEEDTILPILPIIREAVTRRMARTSDQSILRGTGAGTGGDAVSPFKGLTTLSADASTDTTAVAVAAKWTVADLQTVRRQLGAYGLNPGEVKYVVSQDVYYDLLEDADFRTVDMVGQQATILNGQIGYVNGSVVIVSDSYAAKAATVPCVTAVYTGNYYVGNLRNMMVERDTDIEQQKKIIVATRRMGFIPVIGGQGVSTGVWEA
ncbi:MAG: HK97 family phage prohead protease [Desulfobacteraceae bacterium]|nr:HK97 family phage prohead protease [Desulfobacteraceae bacterium]